MVSDFDGGHLLKDSLPDIRPTAQSLIPLAESADREAAWPADSWEILGRGGVLSWSIPSEFGGSGLSTLDQMRGNEALAAACLTTAFLLSQREAAVRWILKGPESIKRRFLPDAARGLGYLTIGISQLTTSRQHCAPALVAKPFNGGFQLDGVIPWVTGANAAQAVIAGAIVQEGPNAGEQILFYPFLERAWRDHRASHAAFGAGGIVYE